MKTTNKKQKTGLKSTLFAAALTIIGFSVHAGGVLNSTYDNDSNNLQTLAMVKGKLSQSSPVSEVTSFLAINVKSLLAHEIENPLRVEDWMLDVSHFSKEVFFESEVESSLELEGWMLNEKTFEVRSVSLEQATDGQLALEDWMLNENIFKVEIVIEQVQNPKPVYKKIMTRGFLFQEIIVEESLAVEYWMINPDSWK